MPIRPENKGRYPKDWPQISQAIRERAGQECEKCRAPNGAMIRTERLMPLKKHGFPARMDVKRPVSDQWVSAEWMCVFAMPARAERG